MGFLSKQCSICNANMFALAGNTLADGCYCKKCKEKLSPFFIHKNTFTVNDLRKQIEERKNNEQLFRNFVPTISIGKQSRLLIDELSGQFVVLSALHKDGGQTPDVMSISKLKDCSIEIVEEKKEVKYKDFQNNIKSFSPPYYAYSYDFFVMISVNIPYIQSIRIKINSTPIDNDQPHILEKSGGISQMFRDALGSVRSYNGMTSNIAEVQASTAYKESAKLANEMRSVLLEAKKHLQEKDTVHRCPWCDSIINESSAVCKYCGGVI